MSITHIVIGTAIAGAGVVLLPGIGGYAAVCVMGAAIAAGPRGGT